MCITVEIKCPSDKYDEGCDLKTRSRVSNNSITNDDLERVRHQLELKINSVSVEHVQTILMAVLGVLVLFGDTIRELIGI